jgi:hypothetical protein
VFLCVEYYLDLKWLIVRIGTYSVPVRVNPDMCVLPFSLRPITAITVIFGVCNVTNSITNRNKYGSFSYVVLHGGKRKDI